MFDFIKKLFKSEDTPPQVFIRPIEIKVNDIIQKHIKSFIEADGGKIKLNRVENNIAYVELSGACRGCPALNLTLKGLIQRKIQQLAPEIDEVRLE